MISSMLKRVIPAAWIIGNASTSAGRVIRIESASEPPASFDQRHELTFASLLVCRRVIECVTSVS